MIQLVDLHLHFYPHRNIIGVALAKHMQVHKVLPYVIQVEFHKCI